MQNLTTEDRFKVIQQKLAQAYHGKPDANLVTKPFPLNVGHVPDDYPHATEITLNRDMQDFSPFLKLVNVMPRKHQKGGSLLIGSQGRVTRTNNTKAGDSRRVGTPKDSTLNEYEMVKAHSDFMLHDDDIDAMSEFPSWADMYRQAFMEAMGNDRIIIGWHGEQHATTSDMSANPLLQDVNKGWLTLLKERASSQVLKGGVTDGEIKIGKGEGNDYANLDHLVQDLYQGIPTHRRTPGMTALIAETILGGAEGIYYQQQGTTPTEKRHIPEKAITGVYGGLQAMPAPYMPQSTILITGLRRNGQQHANLSIYWQKGAWRRKVEYKAEKESSIDWNARREAYHVEDLNAVVALDVDKIVFTDSGFEVDRIPEHKWAEQ